MSVQRLAELLQEGVQAGVFPSAQAVVLHEGRPAFEGTAGGATAETVYDLSSLTKVVGTTAAFLALGGENLVAPQTLLARFFPESPCANARVTLADLLYHRSGLPGWEPFFAGALRETPGLLDPHCSTRARQDARKEVVRAAAATPLAQPRGAAMVYSDVGFILLGEVLAVAAAKPLDMLFADKVFRPLGLKLRFHRLSQAGSREEDRSAPTGRLRPREPAPGQPPHGVAQVPSVPGEVDDDNAWAMDGVAGHSGLFGTAREVARFGHGVLEELKGAGKLASREAWEQALLVDTQTKGSTRMLGFDTPSAEGSAAGQYLGKKPPGAFGHLGFTGTSLWVDRARALVVALLSNRTLLGREAPAQGLREFRARFHDAVVEELGL